MLFISVAPHQAGRQLEKNLPAAPKAVLGNLNLPSRVKNQGSSTARFGVGIVLIPDTIG